MLRPTLRSLPFVARILVSNSLGAQQSRGLLANGGKLLGSFDRVPTRAVRPDPQRAACEPLPPTNSITTPPF